MFAKLLIANRGEISCRIIKTARKLGIRTVAVFSEADRGALHVQLADEALYLGLAPTNQSYLLSEKIIQVALKVGADAIHPGYGFLSENPHFAKLCQENNITFVGPPVAAIEAMGSKSAAKHIMQQANVPLVPGYHGDEQSLELLKSHADKMGYPILLKAAAGGGGKGMRQVWHAEGFSDALDAAKREAMSSFNDDLMLVEKYLTQPRHVEIQVFCDNFGNGVYLFERDCSVQRRHQKVIEEAPAFGMSESLRQQMGETALKAAKAIDYRGAGTVEFLLDSDGQFYFMEMNTRLQVEHPVTEMITGQDLVEWQLIVASNQALPLKQDELKITGHAFEARVYAEDPDNDFLPQTGQLSLISPPVESEHVRVDTGVTQGDEVSVYYDPMIAKLIVWDENRDKALNRLTKALSDYHIDGVTTNIDFLYNLASSQPFREQQIDTGFIEKHHDLLFAHNEQDIQDLIPLAALTIILESKESDTAVRHQDPYSPWSKGDDWRTNEQHIQQLDITANSQVFPVQVQHSHNAQQSRFNIQVHQQKYQCEGSLTGNQLVSIINGHKTLAQISVHDLANEKTYSLFCNGRAIRFSLEKINLGNNQQDAVSNEFVAPMNGTLVGILVEPKQPVKKGQTLMVMEAMKMEHSLKASSVGWVEEFFYQPGELVDGGSELLTFHHLESEQDVT